MYCRHGPATSTFRAFGSGSCCASNPLSVSSSRRARRPSPPMLRCRWRAGCCRAAAPLSTARVRSRCISVHVTANFCSTSFVDARLEHTAAAVSARHVVHIVVMASRTDFCTIRETTGATNRSRPSRFRVCCSSHAAHMVLSSQMISPPPCSESVMSLGLYLSVIRSSIWMPTPSRLNTRRSSEASRTPKSALASTSCEW